MPAFHISPKWTKLFGLGPGVFAQGGIDWLLRDEFTTDAAAPLASPRTCEPGPGTLTIVDTGNNLSISGDKLVFGGRVDDLDPRLVFTSPITRSAGLCLSTYFLRDNAYSRVRLYLSQDLSEQLYWTVKECKPQGSIENVYFTVAAEAFYMVARSAGYFAFAGNKLIWVEYSGSANILPRLQIGTSYGGSFGFDYLRVRQLPAPFDTDYGLATLSVNPGVSGTAYTATADAIHDLTVTAPNPLANTCELRYRVLDDNNYWSAYFDATGAFKLDSVSGGVATNRVNVAGVIAAGATCTIRIIAAGTKHNCYTLAGTSWTRRGSEVNVSHQDTQTTVKPVAGAGWTLGRLTNWPRTSAAYAELDKV